MSLWNKLTNASSKQSQLETLISATSVSESSQSVTSQSYKSICDGEENSATIVSCFFNLCNTIVGSGMLGLPYAFSKTGWLLGTILSLLCAGFSCFALHCLALCALEHPSPTSFYSVAADVVPRFTFLIDIAVAVKCFGVATSYLIVMGDLMPQVMEQFGGSSFSRQRELWVLVGFAMVAPLSCLRSLDSLKFTSLLSIIFVMFLTVIIILYASDIDGLDPCPGHDDIASACSGSVSSVTVNTDTLRTLSIFIFGFTCQQNIFSVVNELRDPTPTRINIVITTAVGVALCVYFTAAGCGYVTFGSEVDSDILVNYPKTYLISLARLMVCLLVAFSYPLQAHPARRCLMTLVANLVDVDSDDNARVSLNSYSVSAAGDTIEDHAVVARYWIVTFVFLSLSLLIGLTITDLGVVLSLVGATGSSIVSYILPGLLYYLVFKDRAAAGISPMWKIQLALLQGCLGVIIIPVCLYFILA